MLEKLLNVLKGKTQPYTISKSVSASSTETVKVKADKDGQVQGQIQVRIYPGPQLSLKIYLYIESADGETRSKLVQFGGKEYIDGDDDAYRWNVTRNIEKDEKVVAVFENTDASNSYDGRINFSINYAGVF